MFKCKHCNECINNLTTTQKANHTRWCDKNPLRHTYNKDTNHLRTESAKKKHRLAIIAAHKDGKYLNSQIKAVKTKLQRGNLKHTDATKNLIKEKALASSHRRLVRSIRNYTKLDGTIISLDSSWEEALAKRLDYLNVKWERPTNPIKYIGLDQKQHNYFPDFYLPDYNLFLDPKNPAAYKSQESKIKILLKLMNNLIIINTLEKCNNFDPRSSNWQEP